MQIFWSRKFARPPHDALGRCARTDIVSQPSAVRVLRRPATAILVGAEPRIVVAVSRSLHKRGIRCVVAVPPGESFHVRSNSISEVVQLDGSLAESAVLLRLLAEGENAAWVTSTSDVAAAIIEYGCDELSQICSIGCPHPEVVARLMHEGEPLWSSRDPLPALQESAGAVTRAIRNAVKRILASLFPPTATDALRSARLLPPGRRIPYLKRRLLRALKMEPRHRLPPTVNSVLFVCHGNLMRSAAGAQFLRDALDTSGLGHIRVVSAGTTTRLGRPADPRVQAAARDFGTSLEDHRSQPLTDELVDQADVIFAMDDLNVVNIAAAFPQARSKVMLLGGIDASGEYAPSEIVDPYLATADDVYSTVTRIHGYVAALNEALSRRPRQSVRCVEPGTRR